MALVPPATANAIPSAAGRLGRLLLLSLLLLFLFLVILLIPIKELCLVILDLVLLVTLQCCARVVLPYLHGPFHARFVPAVHLG